MNKARREKAEALLKELAAIQAEVDMLRDAEEAEGSTLLRAWNCEELAEASEHIEAAIGLLEDARA